MKLIRNKLFCLMWSSKMLNPPKQGEAFRLGKWVFYAYLVIGKLIVAGRYSR